MRIEVKIVEEFEKCPCMGVNLDKLIQPATLTLLASSSLHGYIIVQKLQETSILQGKKPDPSGVYRCLRLMEQRGLVTAEWNVEETGPAKRLYTVTDKGLECLMRWMSTLETYHQSLGFFLKMMKDSIQEKS